MTRCILCYRCVYTADQITNKRVHGVLGRGDASEIGTYIEKAIDNDFSGNVIDVCPVGALNRQDIPLQEPGVVHKTSRCAPQLSDLLRQSDLVVPGR